MEAETGAGTGAGMGTETGTGKEIRAETGLTREWFVRLENISIMSKKQSGFQHIIVMYTSEKEYSTMGPLIDTIMYHYSLPERVRPYLRIWTTPFRTNRLVEGEIIPHDMEFLYAGV